MGIFWNTSLKIETLLFRCCFKFKKFGINSLNIILDWKRKYINSSERCDKFLGIKVFTLL